MMHKVPAKGPAVFKPLATDTRTVWIIPIGGGRCLHARFPGITCRSLYPTMREPETIIMADKPVVRLEADWRDPYSLDQMMAERAAKQVEPVAT